MKIVKRPWGNFKQFVLNKKCSVKILEIKDNEMLSKQFHKYRDEYYYFLDSGLKIEIGNKKFIAKKNSCVKIPKRKVHRLFGGKKGGKVLEISIGKFSESDEVRLEDKYCRK